MWIKNISQHIEKFLNNGLNRNQIFTIFWTKCAEAKDENGLPNPKFKPKFYPTGNEFPEEGIFDGYLRSCRCMLYFYSFPNRFDISSSI